MGKMWIWNLDNPVYLTVLFLSSVSPEIEPRQYSQAEGSNQRK